MNLPTFTLSVNTTKGSFAESLNFIKANFFFFFHSVLGVEGLKNLHRITNYRISLQGVNFSSQTEQKLLDPSHGICSWFPTVEIPVVGNNLFLELCHETDFHP